MHPIYNKRLIAWVAANLIAIGLPYSQKRNRIEIIADILSLCRHPQTQTYIRRHISITYEVLQDCSNQLILNGWISALKDKRGQVRMEITGKGLIFLNKWVELQRLIHSERNEKPVASSTQNKAVIMQSK